MAETPTPGAAAELPVVGYAIRESDQFVWADTRKDRPFAKAWRAVVYADDAQSQLDALREEVARLTKERDEAREVDYFAELAALKAQPSDVDALMALTESDIISLTESLDCDKPGWVIRWAAVVVRGFAEKNGLRL